MCVTMRTITAKTYEHHTKRTQTGMIWPDIKPSALVQYTLGKVDRNVSMVNNFSRRILEIKKKCSNVQIVDMQLLKKINFNLTVARKQKSCYNYFNQLIKFSGRLAFPRVYCVELLRWDWEIERCTQNTRCFATLPQQFILTKSNVKCTKVFYNKWLKKFLTKTV